MITKLKKVFVSLPMGGLSEEQIRKSQATALEKVKEIVGQDVELIDTYLDLGEGATVYDYIGESIKLFSQADYIYFVDGWSKAKGCEVERTVAQLYCKEKVIREKLFDNT